MTFVNHASHRTAPGTARTGRIAATPPARFRAADGKGYARIPRHPSPAKPKAARGEVGGLSRGGEATGSTNHDQHQNEPVKNQQNSISSVITYHNQYYINANHKFARWRFSLSLVRGGHSIGAGEGGGEGCIKHPIMGPAPAPADTTTAAGNSI